MATNLVQTLVQGISQAAQGYDASNPTQARLAIIGQASMLMRTVAQPEELVGIHVANVRLCALVSDSDADCALTDDGGSGR